MNTKNNQRFIDTERRIIQETALLASQIGVQKTTVSDICRKAGINRKSFYLHFPDVSAVIEKIEELTGAELARQFDAAPDQSVKECLISTLNLLCQNKQYYQPIFMTRISLRMFSPLWTEMLSALQTEDGESAESKEYDPYDEIFRRCGLSAMLIHWILHECPETSEEMADRILAKARSC